MARKNKPTHYLNPMDMSVEIPLLELVQLEVSLLKLIQTLHEAGVSAVHRQITDMSPNEDPEMLVQGAVEIYNEIVEKQQEMLDDFLSDGTEDEESLDEIGEADEEELEEFFLENEKDSPPSTMH
ncbi:MAG TPA: hypothetical protein PK395_02215 [bacterium]|nr:hypothetical protein [bacterium]HQP98399.1 hypothetical protein [bacterium]